MHCFATDKNDTSDDPRFGKMGKQKCEDTGALTRKRMETVDEEVTAGAIKFMDKERRCVVDLLPDRQSQTVTEWLRAHAPPEIGIREHRFAFPHRSP